LTVEPKAMPLKDLKKKNVLNQKLERFIVSFPKFNFENVNFSSSKLSKNLGQQELSPGPR